MKTAPLEVGPAQKNGFTFVLRDNEIVSRDGNWIQVGYGENCVEWAQANGQKHIIVDVVGLYSGTHLIKYVRIKANTVYVVDNHAYVIDLKKLMTNDDTNTFDLNGEQKRIVQHAIRTETPDSEKAWWNTAKHIRAALE